MENDEGKERFEASVQFPRRLQRFHDRIMKAVIKCLRVIYTSRNNLSILVQSVSGGKGTISRGDF